MNHKILIIFMLVNVFASNQALSTGGQTLVDQLAEKRIIIHSTGEVVPRWLTEDNTQQNLKEREEVLSPETVAAIISELKSRDIDIPYETDNAEIAKLKPIGVKLETLKKSALLKSTVRMSSDHLIRENIGNRRMLFLNQPLLQLYSMRHSKGKKQAKQAVQLYKSQYPDVMLKIQEIERELTKSHDHLLQVVQNRHPDGSLFLNAILTVIKGMPKIHEKTL